MNQLSQISDDDLMAFLLADEAGPQQAIRASVEQAPAPLSYAQQRLWFLQQFDPSSHAYNLPRAITLTGPLQPDILQSALAKVMDRHDILRTRFCEIDGSPVQVVDTSASLVLTLVDLSDLPAGQREQAVRERLASDAAQPFDLAQAPLMRASLLKLADDHHVLLLNMHHIVSDAWSNPILTQDLANAYALARQQPGQTLPRPTIQYADYARWQRDEYPLSARHSVAMQYWKAYLGDEIPSLTLPHDRITRPTQAGVAGRHPLTLPAGLVAQIQALCLQQGMTPFVVLLGAWQLLLARYSGQRDFTVGVPNATRNQPQIQDLVGCFVSSQVYRVRLDPSLDCLAFLKNLRQQSVAALEHADYPIELILEDLHLQRSAEANPLFQTLFNWRVDAGGEQNPQLGDLHLSYLAGQPLQAKFDLSLDVEYSPQQITAHFEFDTACLLPATIASLAHHWQNLLTAMVEQPATRLGELPMLDTAEQQQQLQTWNRTAVDHLDAAPIHQLVAERAQRSPDALAVRYQGQVLSLGELERRANQLAHKLIEMGVGPDVRVGLGLARSLDLVVAQLAVLKAGGAYVPLDPDYPAERLAYMIDDSAMALLLTQASVNLPVPAHLSVLALDQPGDWLASYASSAPSIAVDGDNLAYMIYTSGSTGQPKGVAVRHAGLTNHMLWMRNALQLGAEDRVLQRTAFSFDASVWEFWLPLLSGAQLVLAPAALADDLSQLWAVVEAESINVLQMAPSLLQALLPHASSAQLTSLHTLLLGGEALGNALVEQLREHWQGRLYNLYGPTEATIDTTLWEIGASCDGAVAAIGRPIANVRTHVLDHDLQPCPPGTPGELLIGGVSLARGYHQRPGLTAERFIPDPIAANGERLYRSGDLARYRNDGVIDYSGRIDHQVKIRGLRIELGEIEAQLHQHPSVQEAVVLAQAGQLVAYVVPVHAPVDAADASQLHDAIKAGLTMQLPQHMVPTHLLLLECLPLTTNGKLDRKALPAPAAAQRIQAYIAPQNNLQQRIAHIWQDVLKRERIGLDDNFFELGGDSIISIQVVSRARQQGIRFTPKDLFQHQTVQGLASVARTDSEGLHIDQGPVSGSAPLLPIQHAFFDSAIAQRQHWNQSVLLKPAQALQPARLEQALAALIAHHDALRLSFTEQPGGWAAEHRADATEAVLWHSHLADAGQLPALVNKAQRSLDLANGPLLRAVLAELGDGSQRLLLVIHHLVVDGVSWRILFDDLQTVYQQLEQGHTPVLPEKTSAYKVWGERLHAHALASAVQAQLAYWQHTLGTTAVELPGARIDASLTKADAHSVSSRLSPALTSQLLQQAPAAYRTQVNDLLLSALAHVMRRWTGKDDVLVQLEGHGRESLFDDVDLTRTVGWFTSLYPLRLSAQDALGATIKGVKEQLRAVPDKGIGFGLLRHLGDTQMRNTLAALPSPRITFNYLGQFDNSFSAGPAALFAPASESSGDDQTADAPLGNWLTLNGQVYNGELLVNWTFSKQMFDAESIQALADSYSRELAKLVEHCCAAHNHGVTPSDFALAKLDQQQLDNLPVVAVDIEDIYPLSPMQQGMLFHSLYEQSTGAYINQMRMDVSGLDPQRLQAAWQQAMDAHDILRTAFIWQDLDHAVQVVCKHVDLPLHLHDWRNRQGLDTAQQTLAQERLKHGFALDQAPLFDIQLVRTGERDYHLIYTSHHILMDGWSTSQLMGEILQRYAGVQQPTKATRYRDYLYWLQQQDQQASEQFWRTRLAQLQAPTLLAGSLPPVLAPVAGQGHVLRQFGAVESRYFSEFARLHKITLNTLMQAAWLVVLHHYTGQQQLCFGATVAGRPTDIPGIEQQVGLFINSLPVIASYDPQIDVLQWLHAVQQGNLELRDHEHTPLADIQRWAGRSGEPLFDSLLVFENYPIAQALQQEAPEGLWFSAVDTVEQTNYPLTLTINAGDILTVNFSFAQTVFCQQAIERLGQHLRTLLLRMTGHPDLRLGQLDLLDDNDRAQQLHGWNDTARNYPLGQPVHQLIEAQVANTPDAVALVHGEQQLSYRQLNARANQLAQRLQQEGIGPDRLVGIAMQRSLEMVISLMAILKAGGAYVPLDPEYPQDRLAYMFDDSGIDLLLTQQALLATLPLPAGLRTLCVDNLALDDQDPGNPGLAISAENLAYVIYTSGSTGKPKGAGNRHSALTNRLYWMQQAYGLERHDCVLQKTPFSFDVSVWEFFWPLMTGARLVMAEPGDHRDPLKLVQLINRHQVTTLHFVPSMLQAFLQEDSTASCTSLTRVVCSGEALQVDTQQQLFARLPGAALYNLYGPTEAAIDVTHWTCRPEAAHNVPIGQPIANLVTYVLNSELCLVPAGVVGELYLGGEGLARGYHRRPGLTAERFVASPFSAGGRLYRTGDLARQRPDGVIEYIGRVDHQVKIRGLRIELGEIEARLLELPQVRETAVLALDNGHSLQLVGYVVPACACADAEQHALREQLKDALKATLPDYMVPAQWQFLAALPLSPNGKLDRKALPRPDAGEAQGEHVAPRSPLEQQLADIWQAVLKRERIGINDNFFELGGDSIISLQVVSRARRAGIHFSPKDLFEAQTVAKLATLASTGNTDQVIEQHALAGPTALLPVQQHFFERDIPERHHWNQAVLLRPGNALKPQALEQALQALVLHHDSLRLTFHERAQGWQASYRSISQQQNDWQQRPLLQVAQAHSQAELEQQCNQLQSSFDLTNGPLLSALLVTLTDGSQRLLLAIHHLLVDGVSWRVLFEDLQTAYQHTLAGQPPSLPAKTTSTHAWAQRLQQYASTAAAQQQVAYWQALLQGASGELPCDHPGGSLESRHGHTVSSRLDAQLTRQLLQDAPAAYRTQINDLLLTALARVITRWSAQPGCLIQLEGHGRENLSEQADLTRSIGWFTSLFPVLLMPQADDLGASLKAIKEQLRAIPHKGIGFGALRYLGDATIRQQLATLAQPRITFNYLGQFDGSFAQGQDALFSPAEEGSGASQSPAAPLANWLTINSQVYGGELRVNWLFSRAMFDEATIERLANAYAEELRGLVQHCLNPEHAGLTPSDVPLSGLDQQQLDRLPVPAAQIADLYPLSPMQQGMLFHTLYEQSAGHYINQLRVDVEGLDPARFQRAWQAVVNRHDILRSGFVWQGLEQPLQMVLKDVDVPFTLHDWCTEQAHDQRLDALARSEREQPFVLDQAPLVRLALVNTAPGRHHLIYTLHHILLDGWSNSQLMGQVLQHYNGQVPAAQAGSYRDYIAWLQQQDHTASLAFWKHQLAPLQAPTLLAQALPATDGEGYGEFNAHLDASTTAHLQHFARQQHITLNTLVQAAWLLLLQRYSGQDCVCFGATVAGRPAQLEGIEQQVGLFINTLPVAATPNPQLSVTQWLQQVQALNLAMREHEHMPLFELQRLAGNGGEGLFDTLLVFENYPISEALEQGAPQGLQFGKVNSQEQTNYPLTLCIDASDTLKLQMRHDRAQISDSQVHALCSHLQNLLRSLSENPQRALGELQMLDASEQQQLLHGLNPEPLRVDHEQCIHHLIEQRSAGQASVVALVDGLHALTYAALDARANRLAHKLIELGVAPEVRVGVAMNRSNDLLVALLAVLKAGGAYVPLDPDYPADRVAYMLEDSRAHLLLTSDNLPFSMGSATQVLQVDAGDAWLAAYSDQPPATAVTPDNLAYVIYTSGSTGLPKGVAIAHRNVSALVRWTAQVYPQASLDGVLASTSVCFDLSVWELFVTLALGGKVIMARNALALPQLPARDQVRLINTVPSAIAALQRAGQIPASVRVINLAGEPLKQGLVNTLYTLDGLEHVYDLYGPSEDTTYSTCTRREPDGIANIGRPIGNTAGYLLGEDLQPVPHGITAELYLAGAGITRGYLAKPSLTAEKFVPNPFAGVGERLYRTNDLTRYGADGNLQYIGRIDHQVKIRGYRVELGEIEARLLQHRSVREAAVLAMEHLGGQQLVAYVVAAEPVAEQVLRSELKQHLQALLPSYMVPAHLMVLAQLPLTPNGKLDRKALPAPQPDHQQRPFVAPRSGLEQQMAAIWQEVLELPQVGLEDNFFECGGHSLLVVRVVSRAQLELGLQVSPQHLFQFPTLGAFVHELGKTGEQFSTDKLSKLEALLDDME